MLAKYIKESKKVFYNYTREKKYLSTHVEPLTNKERSEINNDSKNSLEIIELFQNCLWQDNIKMNLTSNEDCKMK